jgi:hypothetical protein
MENEDKVLYTDVVLQLLSAYNTPSEYRFENVAMVVDSLMEEGDIQGPGLMSGLIFASVLHMTMLLQVISDQCSVSKEDALKMYALTYSTFRHELAQLPQLNPDIVNELMKKFYE